MTEVNPTATISNDAQALMAFQSSKKSMGLSYVLWFFLGMVGAHRFYNGRTGSGAAQLVLCILGWATVLVVVGFFILGGLGIWVLIDAFLIPSWVKNHNMTLMSKLSGGVSPMAVAAMG